jgi:hypothetical protein
MEVMILEEIRQEKGVAKTLYKNPYTRLSRGKIAACKLLK